MLFENSTLSRISSGTAANRYSESNSKRLMKLVFDILQVVRQDERGHAPPGQRNAERAIDEMADLRRRAVCDSGSSTETINPC